MPEKRLFVTKVDIFDLKRLILVIMALRGEIRGFDFRLDRSEFGCILVDKVIK